MRKGLNARKYMGCRFRVASEPESMPNRGQVIEIVGEIRPGYLWLARAEDGSEFQVHTDWLRRFAAQIIEGETYDQNLSDKPQSRL
jgi:hypothetical protein